MQIDFLYYDDCPSHDVALQRLRDVMAAEGIDAPVNIIRVQTEAQAEQHQFVGSPTIRINGRDIDPPDPSMGYALACRAYRRDDGRITPLPTEDLIRRGLKG